MIVGDVGPVRDLVARAAVLAQGSDLEHAVARISERIEGPLRVAIAGRAKAGKSTLLNALVGERLAPTDASECTRIVTWYGQGMGYSVRARLVDGTSTDVPFHRLDGALEVTLGDLSPAAVDRLEVEWPSSRLAGLTLIDTPGLASVDEEAARRTLSALLGETSEDERDEDPTARRHAGSADAVIYLMRHLHRQDAAFLEAFTGGSMAQGSPVDSIAVLSRADELGAGRLDALDSAARISARLAADDRMRRLVSAIVPVCGLLAETGTTLREEEAASLRRVAGLPVAEREALLLSVDRFRFSDRNPLPSIDREQVLHRFGLFGIRHAVALMDSGRSRTAAELSDDLVSVSGIDALESLLTQRFAARASGLKARSGLAALRSLAADLDRRGVAGARDLSARTERAEAEMAGLALLRLLHLALSGQARLADEERSEVERLSSSGSLATRLGVPEGSPSEDMRRAALASIERWRTRSSNPLSDRRTSEAAEIAARAYEQVYAGL